VSVPLFRLIEIAINYANKISVLVLALLAAAVGIGLRLAFDFEHIPNLVPVESVRNKYFDYIIIGGGTAGSVMAYELSKHSNYSVLLIEAGGVFSGLSIVPIASTLMQGTQMDWTFKSVPQSFSSRGLRNAQQCIPRGKGLGGSHQLNYLLHFNGLRRDFDEWARLGADDNWSYNNLESLLNRHESVALNGSKCRVVIADRTSNGESCNRSGGNDDDENLPKLSLTPINQQDSLLAEAFVKAQSELRATFSRNVTFNLARFTTKKGIRHSVYHEYLRRSFKHRNLSILVHGRVQQIEFNENKEAISVVIATKSPMTARVYARKEIVLSAGAIQSPQILQLSGVGDEHKLKSAKINLVQHSPSVGGNLFDHLNFPLFVSINESASVTKSKILSAKEIYRFLMDGTSVLASTAVVGTGLLDDYGVILFGMGSADEQALKHVANFKTEAFRAFFPLHSNASQEGFVALSTCLLPKSRGTVELDHADVQGDPLIDPAYLKDDYDMLCMRNAVQLNIQMVQSKAFRKLNAKIHWPQLKDCENFGPFEIENYKPSERYLDCLIRHAALTAHHPGGTCAIGSVVDNNLR